MGPVEIEKRDAPQGSPEGDKGLSGIEGGKRPEDGSEPLPDLPPSEWREGDTVIHRRTRQTHYVFGTPELRSGEKVVVLKISGRQVGPYSFEEAANIFIFSTRRPERSIPKACDPEIFAAWEGYLGATDKGTRDQRSLQIREPLWPLMSSPDRVHEAPQIIGPYIRNLAVSPKKGIDALKKGALCSLMELPMSGDQFCSMIDSKIEVGMFVLMDERGKAYLLVESGDDEMMDLPSEENGVIGDEGATTLKFYFLSSACGHSHPVNTDALPSEGDDSTLRMLLDDLGDSSAYRQFIVCLKKGGKLEIFLSEPGGLSYSLTAGGKEAMRHLSNLGIVRQTDGQKDKAA